MSRELRNTEVGKARLQAAAARVADALAGRAAKSVRSAEGVAVSAGAQTDLATEAQAASTPPSSVAEPASSSSASGQQRSGQLFPYPIK